MAYTNEPMTRIKALSVIECRAWILERYGEDGLRRVQANMAPAARALIYADHLLAIDWIEVEAAIEHARAVETTFGPGSTEVMVTHLAANHAKGIYRAIVTRPGPQETLLMSSRLWRRYYDNGESIVEFPDDNTAHKRILACPDMPRGHELLLLPYYAELVRQAGARDVKLRHTRCVATGAEDCLTEITWR
jgi:hypothetical protein